MTRYVSAALLIASLLPIPASAQSDVPRAIRRDVPLTNAIRRAFETGTRDRTGLPGPGYWQLRTDYEIHARLDPSRQSVSGSEVITLHNDSPDELDRIVLRLDHNIFRDDVPRGFSVPAEETEGMVVTRLSVNGRDADLYARPAPQRRWDDPRTGITGLDQTVASIHLEEPIPAHSAATVEIDWHTKLPGGPNGRGHRMTQRWENYLFQPTQWYPRIAKYDDLRGWDENVYLGPAEFYNNFGRFDVRIDVPGGWIVSGTGVLQNPEEVLTETARERLSTVLETDDEVTIVAEDEPKTAAGESLVWHFVADQVNDFAWASSPRYVWKATRATIPTRGPVPIHMVYLPDRAPYFERAGDYARHALEFYSALWAPYPFPQLTLQDGPSAGMEYPMVINSNQGAADHETAHQWWPMMVGNNETWYGWMDEGFNVYMNVLSDADADGRAPRLDGLGQQYGQISGLEDEPPMMWNANYGGPLYGFQTYQKAPMMLSMLGGIVGDEAVHQAMRAYTEAWAFRHPSPWDFIFLMDRELGLDLGWFWYYWLWTTESVEGSIESVTGGEAGTTVTVRQDGGMPSPVVLRVELASDGTTAMPNARMIDARTFEVVWPVDVWFGGSRTFDAMLDFGLADVRRVVFDPHCRFPDSHPADNVWPEDGATGDYCPE